MATYNLTSNIPAASSLVVGDILNCSYSGAYKTVQLPAGTYKLEVWGAQGGYYRTQGGKGGYSYGTITLPELTTVYVYAGGTPGNSATTQSAAAGWNGGAATNSYGGGGGGGSDIRINSTSLYARVIVAGGGGGAGFSSTTGGHGGGTSGGQGGNGSATGGYGGSQTSGGTNNTKGTFGKANTNSSNGGGGGGGWYGGSSGTSGGTDSGGGGGSGYVLTSTSTKPSGYLLGSDYYLVSAATVGGNTSFKDYSGSTVTGHGGSGACRITVISFPTDEDVKLKNLYLKIDAKSSLPSSYIELPYIESNATQYIDTGFIPNQNTKIDIETESLGITDGHFIPYGSATSYNSNSFECYSTSGTYEFNYGTEYKFSLPIQKGQRAKIIQNKNIVSLSINNDKPAITSFTAQTFNTPYTLYLFGNHRASSTLGYCRIYKCKIYDNGTLIRNYIPALRVSDSKAGLYDTVNSTFYPDAAGGNFIYNRNNYMDSNTILYLQGDTLTDSSPNSLTFTNNGVTVVNFERNDFHKKALYFNGSSSYMTTNFSHTGDITFEAWIYQTSTTNTSYPTPYAVRASSYRGMYFHANNSVTFCGVNSSGGQITDNGITPVPVNKWVHYAQVRQGTTIYNFIDGKLKSTIANSGTTASGLTLGTLSESDSNLVNASCYFQGYMTDIKISKGAKWISNFTPYELIHGTNYAIIQESYIKTSSTTHTSQYSGYTLLPYIEKSIGSEYIDTGFKPNQNTRVIMDFEFTKNTTSAEAIFGGRTTYQSNMFSVFTKANNIGFQNDYGAIDEQNNLCLSKGRILIDKNKNVLTINNRIINVHTATTFTSTNNLLIGSCTENNNLNMATSYPSYIKIYSCKVYDNGTLIRDYIPAMRNSDLKIGLYDKQNEVFYPDASGRNFSCNTLDIDAATKLLLNGNITDASNNNTITNTNTTVVNAKLLNDTSLYFNSSLLTTNNYNYVSGTNNFTVDWWEYPTSLVAGSAVFQAGTDYGGLLLAYLSTATDGSNLYAYGGTNTTSWDIMNNIIMGTVKLNKWTHRAVSRNGNTFYFFENGKLINTATSSGSLNSTKHQIGGYTYQNGTKYFMGYINSFRISNTARWTSDFIPPTQTYGANWRKIKEIYIKRDPSTAEPKMSQYDTNIYTESDGSKWIRIFHHNNPTSYLFDSTDDFTKDVYKDANRWASLYLLKDLDVKEIMVKQTAASGGTVTSYRWYQPKNPIDSTYADVAKANIIFHPGYTAPNTSYGGIYLHKTSTYLAANNSTSGNWWGAFGSWTAHDGGTPGYNATTIKTGYMDLYIPYKEPEAWVKI